MRRWCVRSPFDDYALLIPPVSWHDASVNKEPQLDEISDDDNQPATKGDVRNAVDELAGIVAEFSVSTEKRFSVIENDLGTVKDDVAGLKKSTEHILEVVDSIDEKMDNLPERVARLEKESLGFVGK